MKNYIRWLGIGCIVLALGALSVSAWADDGDSSDTGTPTNSMSTQTQDKNNKKNDNSTVDAQNNRMQSIVGSSSRWSGHLNFTYTGPAITNPFGGMAPNPLGQIPPPFVSTSGTISIRYRLDPASTISAGFGLQGVYPFSTLKTWDAADPYLNYNRMIDTGPVHNYVSIGPTWYTDPINAGMFGYLFGAGIVDESYHVFSFGLTAGVDIWVGANVFSPGKYDMTQQDLWYLGGGPYLEYELTSWLNVRSVLGIQGDHTLATAGGAVHWEHPYQTLGLGIQILKPWYVYTYVIGSPYSNNFVAQNVGLGFNTIINLF